MPTVEIEKRSHFREMRSKINFHLHVWVQWLFFLGGVFFSTFVLVTILKTKRIPCWVKFSRCFMLFHLFFHLWTFYPAKFTNISTSRICHPFKNPPKFMICPDLSLRRRLYNFQFLKTKSNSEIVTSQKILP